MNAIIGVPVRIGHPTPGRRRVLAVLLVCPGCSEPHAYYSKPAALFAGKAVRRCANQPGVRFILLAGRRWST